MSDRIRTTFERLRAQGRTGLVPYVTACDPDKATTAHVLRELAAGGADVIELGVPFSDPMADGPAICAAMDRALKSGATFDDVLDIVREFRGGDDRTPIVLFGYLNPLYQIGLDEACQRAADAGADALLVVDLPPEEAAELTELSRPRGLDFIGLFTPTSDDARVATIAEHASGFAYYVSVAGVTGGAIAALDDLAPIERKVASVREISGLPVAVGFGIRTPEDAARVGAFADAVVVGSALIRAMAEVAPIEAPGVAGDFMRAFRSALDGGVEVISRDSVSGYELDAPKPG